MDREVDVTLWDLERRWKQTQESIAPALSYPNRRMWTVDCLLYISDPVERYGVSRLNCGHFHLKAFVLAWVVVPNLVSIIHSFYSYSPCKPPCFCTKNCWTSNVYLWACKKLCMNENGGGILPPSPLQNKKRKEKNFFLTHHCILGACFGHESFTWWSNTVFTEIYVYVFKYFLPALWMGLSYYLLFLVCRGQATQQLQIFNWGLFLDTTRRQFHASIKLDPEADHQKMPPTETSLSSRIDFQCRPPTIWTENPGEPICCPHLDNAGQGSEAKTKGAHFGRAGWGISLFWATTHWRCT